MEPLKLRDIVNVHQAVIFDGSVVNPIQGSYESRREYNRALAEALLDPSNLFTTRDVGFEIWDGLKIKRKNKDFFSLSIPRIVDIRCLSRDDFHVYNELFSYLKPIGVTNGIFDNSCENGNNDIGLAAFAFLKARDEKRTAFISGDKKLVELVGVVAESVTEGVVDNFPCGLAGLNAYYFSQAEKFYSKYDENNDYILSKVA